MSTRVIVVVDDLLFNRVVLTRMLNQVRDILAGLLAVVKRT